MNENLHHVGNFHACRNKHIVSFTKLKKKKRNIYLVSNNFLSFFLFGHTTPCSLWDILVPWPGMEPGSLAVEARSPNHPSAREFQDWSLNLFPSPNSRCQNWINCLVVWKIHPRWNRFSITCFFFSPVILPGLLSLWIFRVPPCSFFFLKGYYWT